MIRRANVPPFTVFGRPFTCFDVDGNRYEWRCENLAVGRIPGSSDCWAAIDRKRIPGRFYTLKAAMIEAVNASEGELLEAAE